MADRASDEDVINYLLSSQPQLPKIAPPADLLPVENCTPGSIIEVVVLETFISPGIDRDQQAPKYFLRSAYEKIISEELQPFYEEAIRGEQANEEDHLRASYRKFFPARFWNDKSHLCEMYMRFDACRFLTDNFDDFPSNIPYKDCILSHEYITKTVGCEHRICGCQYKCNECSAKFGQPTFYACEKCHEQTTGLDESIHSLADNNNKVSIVKCNYCGTEQSMSLSCTNCKRRFGNYMCEQCNIVALLSDMVQSWHCPDCKRCVMGVKDQTKHCHKCRTCIELPYYENHRMTCTGPMEIMCCVCNSGAEYGDRLIKLPCSAKHIIHLKCYNQLVLNKNYNCPICSEYIFTSDTFSQKSMKIRYN